MEDGKKPNGCIPKIPQRDITLNDVDWMIGLHDSEMMKLANTILAKEISIKSNKLSDRLEKGRNLTPGLVLNPQAYKNHNERAHGRVLE